jgi:sulfhydrogenase subunit delta
MAGPTMGIFGLTGCAGDQLTVLNCEDELLELVRLVDIRDFLMASSANDEGCRLDIALVEGSVVGERDEAKLRRIRERSDLLVALGTCAMWGGIATMDRDADRAALTREIYGDAAADWDTGPARALHEVVAVDLAIPGCPIEKTEFLAAVGNLLNGDVPLLPDYPVCTECRMREHSCLLMEKRLPCCGPLTAAGCDARCIGYGIPCIGCRGPVEGANLAAGLRMLEGCGVGRDQVARKLRTFAPVPLPA